MIEFHLDPSRIIHDRGLSWSYELPSELSFGDSTEDQTCSKLRVFEDDRELGPGHSHHDRIRLLGRGLFSHWGKYLFFASSDGSAPTSGQKRYKVVGPVRSPGEVNPTEQDNATEALFPRLERLKSSLRSIAAHGSLDILESPSGSPEQRLRMVEAKLEYALDELYVLKTHVRHLVSESQLMTRLRHHQIETFNYQWKHLPYHDNYPSNPKWKAGTVEDLCQRLGVEQEWFKGKKVLDCGCGPGRHTWTMASLGADVTAFDTSENGLAAARDLCRELSNASFHKCNILEPLPFHKSFDLVWSYGVIHCTGNTFGALANIASHVISGGLLYFMVYSEPARTSEASYRYYHEIYALRNFTRQLTFEQKSEIMRQVSSDKWALSWFDAISSEINDLYTMEELAGLLSAIGFGDVRRTMPNDPMLNVVSRRLS
jgi:2-polyprenyl-3-methyl-5-hydroxy-6-metoxy-1,4-benzoquinol methylase